MPLLRQRLFLAAAVALFATATSCVVHVTDDDGQGECESDRECPGARCDFDTGHCAARPSCTSTSECPSGEVCSGAAEAKCVSPTQGNCQQTYPEQGSISGKAFLVGLSADLSGPDAITGNSIANAAKLGVDVFNDNGGVGGTDPIVLVLCDDTGESEAAADNARTLDAMGVSAMIGPTYSGQTLAAATTTDGGAGSVENDLLLLSTGATNPVITGIEDASPSCVGSCGGDTTCSDACPGLVWRTSPSDELQGRVLASYFEQMEPHVKARGGEQRTTTRVAVLYGRGAYGELLSEVLRVNLQVNGQAATAQQGQEFFILGYDSTGDGSIDDSVVAEAIALEPDAVFLIGTSEVGLVLERFENDWPGADADRPYYFFSDGGLSSDVADVARTTGAAQRVRGSVPGTQNSRFAAFAAEYRSRFPATEAGDDPSFFGAAGAYDAVHLLGYAALATRSQPRTAEALARGFSRLVSGEEVAAGPADLGVASALLENGATFDFEGASGPLDYDLSTGDAPGDYQIWCIPSEPAGVGSFSGIAYDAKLDAIVGTDTGDAFVCPSN